MLIGHLWFLFYSNIFSYFLKAYIMGFYMKFREILWCLRVILFSLIMVTVLLVIDYSWEWMSFWGYNVITNIFTVIFLTGKTIGKMVIRRFYCK